MEDFAPGIGLKESIAHPTTDNLAIGYYKVEAGTPDFKMEMPFEEVDYIIEGTATITDETGKTYTAKKGDLIYMNKGAKVTISYSNEVGFAGVYVITPHNWRELIAGKK